METNNNQEVKTPQEEKSKKAAKKSAAKATRKKDEKKIEKKTSTPKKEAVKTEKKPAEKKPAKKKAAKKEEAKKETAKKEKSEEKEAKSATKAKASKKTKEPKKEGKEEKFTVKDMAEKTDIVLQDISLDDIKKRLMDEAQKHDGLLSEDNVHKIIDKYELTDDDQDQLFSFCQDQGILETSDEELLEKDDSEDTSDDDDEDNSLEKKEKDEDVDEEEEYALGDYKNADPVRQYLHAIGTYQVLPNQEEEIKLAKRIIAGNEANSKLKPFFHAYQEKGGKVELSEYDENRYRKTEDEALKEDILFENWKAQMEFPTTDEESTMYELKIEADDGKEAKDTLIQCNLKLVVSIAKHYVNRGMDFLDLIQEGNLGLMKAVDKFDYTRGFKFSTYATWWIRQAITRALADQARTIRIPVHMVETINKIARAQRRLVQKLSRDPTPKEIADELDNQWSPQRIVEIQQIALDPLSLEKPVGEEEDSHVGDFIVDKDNESPYEYANRAMETERIEEVLNQLTDREARVIRLRYGFEDGRTHTLEEVGKEFNVTRERIRQIEAKALKKLRHPSRSKLLKDFR